MPQAATLVPEAPPRLPAVATGHGQAWAITGAGDAYCGGGGRGEQLDGADAPAAPVSESIR